jgi:hypothetical protein
MRRRNFSRVVLGTRLTEPLCFLSFGGEVSEHLNLGNKRTLKIQYQKFFIFEIKGLSEGIK